MLCGVWDLGEAPRCVGFLFVVFVPCGFALMSLISSFVDLILLPVD